MFRRDTRVYRRALLAVAVLVAAGAGVFAYYMYAQRVAQDNLPKTARETYEQGRQALDDKNAARALELLEKAQGLTEKALTVRDEEIKKAESPADKEKEWQDKFGQLLWLKARIACDTAFAAALQENKPIAEITDSITGESFRSVRQIPNPALREDAIGWLRQAAALLPKDLQVQEDVLRLELMYPEFLWNWANIQRAADRIVDLDRENVRANYFLARAYFEQYREGRIADKNGNLITAFQETPANKRSREQVEKARVYLQAVKPAENNPIWRTLYLEAQIVRWLVKQAPAGSREKPPKDDKQFMDLLFDQALPRARRQEKFANLSRVDINGLIGLHDFAVDQGIEQARASLGTQTDILFTALRDYAVLADNLWEIAKPFRGEMLEANMRAAATARRFLGAQTPVEWPAIRDHLEALARRAAEAGVSRPDAYALLAYMLNVEAFLEGKRLNAAVKADLDARSMHWLQQGLELARAAQTPLLALVELHGVALEVLISRGEKSDLLTPHLDALRRARNDKRAAAILDVNEAAIDVRQGKLGLARGKLEMALANPEIKDLRPRALTLLASVLLSTQQSAQAVVVLKQLQQTYKRVEDLNPVERAWMLEFLRDPQEIALLILTAELDTAAEKYEKFVEKNVDKRPMDLAARESIKSNEDAAVKALGTLKLDTDANLKARATFVNYYLRRGQTDQAAAEVRLLKNDYPHRVEVLRYEVAMAMLPDKKFPDKPPPDWKNKADAIIQAFIRTNPTGATGSAARRFWVEWLIRTSRTDEALAYLDNRDNFPGQPDDAGKRVLFDLLVQHGKRDQAVEMLRRMPKDQSIELLLIQHTANPVERDKLVKAALTSHENNGQFRLWEGEKLLGDAKYAEAAQLYWDTSEFTRVRMEARVGLMRAMIKLAETDPNREQQLAEKFMQDAPGDPMLYALAAYALLKKEEFGAPADSWEGKKTMCAALKAWQDRAAKTGFDDNAATQVFKAEFWQLANRPDKSWDELKPRKDLPVSRDARVLSQLVVLAIQSGEDDKLAEAVNYMALLKDQRPDFAGVRLLEARLLARRGDLAAASDILERTLIQQPQLGPVYPVLIKVLNDRRQTDKAARWTQQWLERAVDDPIPFLERIRQDLVAGRIAIARERSFTFYSDAEDRVNKRLPKTADPDLEKGRQKRLLEVRLYANLALGQTWQQAGQLDGAEEFVSRCLKDDPKNEPARLLHAQIAIARKDWPTARAIYEDIFKAAKGNYVATTNLAWLLAQHLGQPAEALKLIRPALLNPYTGKPTVVERLTPEYLDIIGKVFAQAARKQADRNLFDEMKAMFGKASIRYPADPRMFLHLGEACAGLSQPEQAVVAYQMALNQLQSFKGPFAPAERQELIDDVALRLKALKQ